MIREKTIARKQICLAISENDFETARILMSDICTDETFRRKSWSDDETEFLMNHVEALGLDEACKVVGKKLDRTTLSANKKYHSEMRKARKGLMMCQ